ncbi:MAG: Uma2 family endonuclease [Terracidiphilus sp.]|jgi:Uma2 family endonuclease
MAKELDPRDNDPMATLPNSEELWTVREYLSTTWSPDREYVDGRIEERNLGEKEHSLIQRYLTFLFMLKRTEWAVEVFPELRTQIAARNFRVPDVLVIRAGEPFDRYLKHPPMIAIEILSPEDRLTAFQEKAAQYRVFGIENIWIVDPERRIAYRYTGSALEEERSGELAVTGTPIRVVLSEMFAELDRV